MALAESLLHHLAEEISVILRDGRSKGLMLGSVPPESLWGIWTSELGFDVLILGFGRTLDRAEITD